MALPFVLRRLIIDAANDLTGSFSIYQLQVHGFPVGQVSREVYKSVIATMITRAFMTSFARSGEDYAEMERQVRIDARGPRRPMRIEESYRAQAFTLGCSLYGRIHSRLDGIAPPTAAEAESITSKIGGAWQGLNITSTYRFLEPKLSELVLRGAQTAREGNSCLSAGLYLLFEDPSGSQILESSWGSGGGGGTQF